MGMPTAQGWCSSSQLAIYHAQSIVVQQASAIERQDIKSKASLEDRQAYFDLCSYPITKEIEDAMEQVRCCKAT